MLTDAPLRISGVIRRRELLQRDPPVDWRKVIQEIRAAGWGTGQICFVLNVNRGTLWRWESCGSPPNFEDGRAMLKLLKLVQD